MMIKEYSDVQRFNAFREKVDELAKFYDVEIIDLKYRSASFEMEKVPQPGFGINFQEEEEVPF